MVGINQQCQPYHFRPKTDGYSVWQLFDKTLIQFSHFGEEKKIGIASTFDGNEKGIFFARNNRLYDADFSEHDITLHNNMFGLHDTFVFCATRFLDSCMIVKYDFEQREIISKSSLLKSITILLVFDRLFAINENEIITFDLNLVEINRMQTPDTYDLKTTKDKIAVISSQPGSTILSVFDSNLKSLWQKELTGEIVGFDCGSFIYVSTHSGGSFCFDFDGNHIWTKGKGSLACFVDRSEHVILADETKVSIYETFTGVLVWKAELSYPACSSPCVVNDGFFVCSHDGGGMHYFGRTEKWEFNF